MKKLLSAILILVLVLSVGSPAFADHDALCITKDPTDKLRTAGETAIFSAGASGYSAISWVFVSPDGIPCSAQDFRYRFPYASVDGEHTETLMVKNLGADMNGWGVFCSFSSNEAEVYTAVAHLNVHAAFTAVPFS